MKEKLSLDLVRAMKSVGIEIRSEDITKEFKMRISKFESPRSVVEDNALVRGTLDCQLTHIAHVKYF